jgi:hypothetical protein
MWLREVSLPLMQAFDNKMTRNPIHLLIPFFTLFTGCICPQKNTGEAGFITPAIIVETIDQIVAGLPEEGRKEIAAMSGADDMVKYHHGWGTGLRNSLGLWGDSELANAFKEIGVWHADDMSGILMDSVWRRVNKKELNIEAQVQYYKAYWGENLPERKKPCPECSEILEFRQSFPLVFVKDPNRSFDDYEFPKFPEVDKMVLWYRCPNGHEYISTSEKGFAKPDKRHLEARKRREESLKRLDEAHSETEATLEDDDFWDFEQD